MCAPINHSKLTIIKESHPNMRRAEMRRTVVNGLVLIRRRIRCPPARLFSAMTLLAWRWAITRMCRYMAKMEAIPEMHTPSMTEKYALSKWRKSEIPN